MSSGQADDSVGNNGASEEQGLNAPVSEGAASEDTAANTAAAGSAGPLSLDRIRQLRASQEAEARKDRPRGDRPPKDRGPKPDQATAVAAPVAAEGSASVAATADTAATASTGAEGSPAGQKSGEKGKRRPFSDRPKFVPPPEPVMPKIEVPSRRAKLPSDLENELESALSGTDLDRMLIGDAMVQVGHDIEEGKRIQGKVLKVHGEHVFVSLGGPNEGVISVLQFENEIPEPGTILEVMVRGYLNEEGLYDLGIPGSTISVSDWEDLKEGEVVEAKVTAANAGGLECTVGNVRGFIPASQAAEYRIENLAELVDQRVLCVITQVNPARGNLVLSRRAVLEREKAEKRQQRLNELEVGSAVEGTVRKIMDFGAFVDIGGLDGLIHLSQLSWERIKHPSEILQEGQKIQVRVDKFDAQTGKISLSYRSLQDHPWTGIESRFPVGAIVKGTVSRIADFGAFVRLAIGVEGLIHLSELANHRVHRVGNHVKEGQEVEVKVLSVEAEKQRIGLSLKAAQAPATVEAKPEEPEVEEPPRELALPKHRGPLKGGMNRSAGGEQFGLKW